MSVPQSGSWIARLKKRLPQVLIILTIVLMVIVVLFVIVYEVGIHHHHSSANREAILTLVAML